MKPSTILIIVLAVALVIMGYREFNSQSTKQELKAERDSLLNDKHELEIQQEITIAEIYALKEQIGIMDTVIFNREMELDRANKRTSQIQYRYEKPTFRTYPNDTLRMRALAKHFPSLQYR